MTPGVMIIGPNGRIVVDGFEGTQRYDFARLFRA